MATPSVEERTRQDGATIIRRRIFSVPNSRRNIALAPVDAVPGVANVPVPIWWAWGIKWAARSAPRVVPWAPAIWAGGRRRPGGTCAQRRSGQTQSTRHQHSRCEPRHSIHSCPFREARAPDPNNYGRAFALVGTSSGPARALSGVVDYPIFVRRYLRRPWIEDGSPCQD
jgi:hypothetical protein